MLGQRFKVMALAKERSEVGGQRIDELLPFLIVLLQVAKIGAETVQAEGAQPPGEAAVNHLVLAF